MKNVKNTFILVIICLITAVIFFQIYVAYSYNSVDTNSYVELVEGQGVLNEEFLDRQIKYIIVAGDEIRVIGEKGLAIIEWGDGSITRLGGNTKIKVDQNSISKDRTEIHIRFDLLAGKTWSNIVSYIGPSSEFTQSFEGLEAGVRGTVFDVDLTQSFLHVSDHEVTLSDPQTGTLYAVGEQEPFNIDQRTFIDLQDFISYFQDTSWSELNTRFDSQYLSQLTKSLENSIERSNPFLLLMEKIFPSYRIIYELDTTDDYMSVSELIDRMSQKTRNKSYNRVLKKYQTMNFIDPEDGGLFDRKLRYKQALLDLSDTVEQKENLLLSTAYDVQDMLTSGDTTYLTVGLTMLEQNASLLPNIDISFLSDSVQLVPEGLREQFGENFEAIQSIFLNGLGTPSLEDIQLNPESARNALKNADSGVQNFLESQFGDKIQQFKK